VELATGDYLNPWLLMSCGSTDGSGSDLRSVQSQGAEQGSENVLIVVERDEDGVYGDNRWVLLGMNMLWDDRLYYCWRLEENHSVRQKLCYVSDV
jgi:hypothetical protein